jgi:hypothetical protein
VLDGSRPDDIAERLTALGEIQAETFFNRARDRRVVRLADKIVLGVAEFG